MIRPSAEHQPFPAGTRSPDVTRGYGCCYGGRRGRPRRARRPGPLCLQ
jgi:hypothetical protein